MSASPFRTWNDVPTTEFHPGVHLRAIGHPVAGDPEYGWTLA